MEGLKQSLLLRKLQEDTSHLNGVNLKGRKYDLQELETNTWKKQENPQDDEW